MSHNQLPPAPLQLNQCSLPVVGPVRVYTCGVTPYGVTHLGHASTFVWVDALTRVLRHAHLDVILARNVTDVDDVLTEAARAAHTPYDEFAAMQQYRFDHDMASLGVRRPEFEPRAHRHIGDVVKLAQGLVDNGSAYVGNGSVYFHGRDVASRAGLSEAEAIELSREFGEDFDDAGKRHPLDTAVWRASGSTDPAWPSPWGLGRPGWHGECAAMVLHTFGSSIDIHAGGKDLHFPHHAYESAMAEAVTGVQPFARAWMHVGTVSVNDQKMAKSTGNLVLIEDLLKNHRAAAIRLYLLDRVWSQDWEFTTGDLAAAEGRLDALYAAAGRRGNDAAEADIMSALVNDLDVPRAVAIALEEGGRAARGLNHVLGLG